MLLYAGFTSIAWAGVTEQAPKEKQPSTWDLIRKAQTKQAKSAEMAKNERVIHFPRERSLGRLLVQDENAVRHIETFYHWIDGTKWEYFGEAQGRVTVPAGKRLSLSIDPDAWKDLSPLANLGADDLYKLTIYGRYPDGPDPDDRCMPHIAHLTGLKVLSLKTTNIGDKGLKFIKNFKSLEYLDLPRRVTDVGLGYVAELSSLKGLYCGSNRFTNAGLHQLAKLTKLEELDIGSVYKDETGQIRIGVNDAGLVHLAKLPRLRYLMLQGEKFTDAGMAHLKNVPSLRILSLGRLPITSRGLEHLSKCSGLENLHLYRTKVTDEGLAHLKSIPSLKKLSLLFTEVTDEGMIDLGQVKSLEYLQLPVHITDRGLDHLSQLDNLKYLWVGGGSKSTITDAGLEHIAKLCMLEELLIGGRGITDEGMSYIAELTRLKKLNIGTAPVLTNSGLAKLTKMKSLESLDLNFTKVTISGLAQLNAMPNLTKLDVKPLIRDNSVLDIGKLTKLEELRLRFQPRSDNSFSDEDLACLAGLKHLKSLSIGPRNFTDKGMAYLAGLTNMERLGIGGPNLTDQGLKCLANMKKLWSLSLSDGYFTEEGLRYLEGFKRLRYLSIPSANAFSNAALRRLRENLPNLQTLKVIP